MKYILNDNIKIKTATPAELNILMKFQSDIINKMEHKEFFTPLTEEEFLEPINGIGNVYMLFYHKEMIGLFVLNASPSKEIISEYNLENPTNIGIFDSIMIKEKYRGYGLQRQCISYLDKKAKKYNLKEIIATVHPDNKYSLNNFLKMKYQITNKLKIHNGTRYLIAKKYN